MSSAPATAGDYLSNAHAELANAGIENPSLEARLLVEAGAGISQSKLRGYPETPLPADAQTVLSAYLARRTAGEPLAHIIGEREFWSLTFKVTPDTLIPRPDSETLIDTLLDHLHDREKPHRVLDIGTGTGCLLAAILSEFPNATGLGIDRSAVAADVDKANLTLLGLGDRAEIRPISWDALPAEPFDVILCNPPYIPDADIAALEPEVRDFEPHGALAGGVDGLDAYRGIAARLPTLLTPNACAVFEIGLGQRQDVQAIFEGSGLVVREIRKDLAGIERCLLVTQ